MNVASGPMLYYLHPDVSFFKGNGFTALGPYLDMPDNSSAGNVSPPEFGMFLTFDFSACCVLNAFNLAGLEPARH